MNATPKSGIEEVRKWREDGRAPRGKSGHAPGGRPAVDRHRLGLGYPEGTVFFTGFAVRFSISSGDEAASVDVVVPLVLMLLSLLPQPVTMSRAGAITNTHRLERSVGMKTHLFGFF
jgi:hypothetical protein